MIVSVKTIKARVAAENVLNRMFMNSASLGEFGHFICGVPLQYAERKFWQFGLREKYPES